MSTNRYCSLFSLPKECNYKFLNLDLTTCSLEDIPDSEDYAESIYYPLISIVRNDSGFIMKKSGSGQTILKMPAALIMPDDLGYSCYDVV